VKRFAGAVRCPHPRRWIGRLGGAFWRHPRQFILGRTLELWHGGDGKSRAKRKIKLCRRCHQRLVRFICLMVETSFEFDVQRIEIGMHVQIRFLLG